MHHRSSKETDRMVRHFASCARRFASMASFADSALTDLSFAVKEVGTIHVRLLLSHGCLQLQRITCEESKVATDQVAAAVQLCTEIDLILRHGYQHCFYIQHV
jgi:hypothetical protein